MTIFYVLNMIGGTMGLVQLFIDSRMPERMANMITVKVPNVQWAAVSLSLFAGIGIPFTLSAIVPAYILIWILFGV